MEKFDRGGELGLLATVTTAHGQLMFVANNFSFSNITITPPDPSVLATNESPEIFAIDVPPIPSSRFVQVTVDAAWEVDYLAASPIRARFILAYNFTSPALPSGVFLGLGTPFTLSGRTNNALDEGSESSTVTDSFVLTRAGLAQLLLLANPNTLTQATAAAIVDQMFFQGFHVSFFARLRSLNISAATVISPNVSFFAQPGR
jgi:hypothetical protein